MYNQKSEERLSRAYKTENPRLMARIRAAGKTMEETEDLIHDVYTETWGRLDRSVNIINLHPWLNSLVTRRLIDAYVRQCMVEAQDEAVKSLPVAQRKVVEEQSISILHTLTVLK